MALHKRVYFCLQISEHNSYALNNRTRIHMSKNPYRSKYCISPNIRWFSYGSLSHRSGGFFYKRGFNKSSRNMSLSSKYWLIRHAVVMFVLGQYYSECFRSIYIKIYQWYIFCYNVLRFFLNKVVSPLPGKALFLALYGICLIKIRLVLYNLRVPFAGWQAKILWKEERGDDGQGNVTAEGKYWQLWII